MDRPPAASQATTAIAQQRYDRLTMALHWLTVLVVVTLWSLAQVWGLAPKGSAARHAMQALHVSFGLVLIAILTLRVLWRAGPGRRLPPADTGLLQMAAKAVHWGLYALLGVQAGLGVFGRWFSEDPLAFFGLFAIPSPFARDKALEDGLISIHDTIATIILIVAGLHAAAALWHHYVRRDGVLRRMLP